MRARHHSEDWSANACACSCGEKGSAGKTKVHVRINASNEGHATYARIVVHNPIIIFLREKRRAALAVLVKIFHFDFNYTIHVL